jgi:hypothetical protein
MKRSLLGQCCVVWYMSVNASEENTIIRVEQYAQQARCRLQVKWAWKTQNGYLQGQEF